jgi:LPXTG-motif cell wall-anchored protein
MKMGKWKKWMTIVVAVLLVLQMLPLNPVTALESGDVSLNGSDLLVIHGTDYVDPDGLGRKPSSLEVILADGKTVLSPVDGKYENVPEGAKISLVYAFHLEDGVGAELYDYTGNEYFTATLPAGLNFATASGTVEATDADSGDKYILATWSISGNALTVELTNAGEDSTGNGGAANDAHLDKWGWFQIDGTFRPLSAGDGTSTAVEFGSQRIVINRQPLPMESTLAKSGSYDASTNHITWTVKITPPAGDPNMAYDGYSLIDVFGPNQTYVANSFTVGVTSPSAVQDTELGLTDVTTGWAVCYTFPDTDPDTTGVQTIQYKTSPTDFSAENGSATDGTADYSEFTNTASLKRGSSDAAKPVIHNVRLNWLEKAGVTAATTADPTIAKWTVTVTVPGEAGKSISGAQIVDSLQSELELIEGDASHPIQIQFGTGGKTTVTAGGTWGEYGYSGDTLTYRFPTAGGTDGKVTAGTTATLTYYTRVKAGELDSYLNNNSEIAFTNSAKLVWAEYALSGNPSDTTTIGNGVGQGGLLSKSAAGTENYVYSAADPGTIHWTVTVNRNRITVGNAKIADSIPTGQALLIDSEHLFKVTKKGSPDTVIYRDDNTSVSPDLGVFITTPGGFTYEFPDEDAADSLDDTIKSTYTVDYYTRIVDVTPGTPGESSGLDTLYKNGSVDFKNGVTLTRDGSPVGADGTKTYPSQMINKAVVAQYDYNTRLVQWKIVVDRNKLPLTGAVVTDTIPAGMALFIDGTHSFKAVKNGGTDEIIEEFTSTSSSINLTFPSAGKFAYKLPLSISDQYTITFWTQMNEDTLKTQWNGTRPFTNNASLGADQIPVPVSAAVTAQIENPVITKSHTYVAGSREDHIDWSTVINPGQVHLTRGVVTDVLNSGLQLVPDSVKLYSVSIDGSTGKAVNTTKVPVPDTTYTVTLPTPDNTNTLTISLPENTGSAYLLEFTTDILLDSLTFTNSISLSGTSGEPTGNSSASQIAITNLYSGGASGSNTLTVHKTDSAGHPLKDAEFTLLNVNRQPITSGGNPIIRTTGTNGDAVFNNLPSWVFYVKETKPAPGYLLPSDPIAGGIRLSGAGTIPVSNAPALGSISFVKKGANGVPLTGGTFTLTGKDYKDADVSTTASAVSGMVTFANVPLGKAGEHYTITETIPPEGHAAADPSATLTATVEYNADKTGVIVDVTPAELVNTPSPGTVSFDKKGASGAPLTGGLFTLTGTDYAGGAVSTTASAVNGTVTFADVPLGKTGVFYTIEETSPPEGYLLPADTNILTATVEYNPTNTGVVGTVRAISPSAIAVSEYINAPALGSISFTKTSAAGIPLTGGMFTLTGTDYAGSAVALTASSAAGTVTFNNVPLGNNYIIRETIAPPGYVRSSTELTASVSYNGDKTAVETDVNPKTLANEPENSPGTVYGSIEVMKTDKDGHKLAGATFSLYLQSGGLIATAVSDSQGTARFSRVPEGQYTLRETGAPKGYILSTESINVSITGTATRTFTMINEAENNTPGSIRITKTDSAGNALSGAEFTLYGAGGIKLNSIVTGSDGHAVFNNVSEGSYTVSETRAPAGYAADIGSTAVTVTSGKTSDLTFINRKISIDPGNPKNPENPGGSENPGSSGNPGNPGGPGDSGSLRIKKADKNSNPLSGAEFTLYSESGTAVIKAVSGADGLVLFTSLAPGKYSVRETAAPDGYKLFAKPLVFDIKAGQMLKYTLKNVRLTDKSDVVDWIDDMPIPGGTLPQTGGVPGTLYTAMAGLILITTGLLLAKNRKHQRKNNA